MAQTLVLLEHDHGQLKRPSLNAITLARQLGGDFALLLIGQDLGSVAASVAKLGAIAVLAADDPALAEPLADKYAAVLADVARAEQSTTIVATSSTFSKDILPRAAALLDVPMLTDVLAVEHKDGTTLYRRPVSAGGMIATVKLEGDRRALTARGTAFAPPAEVGETSPVRNVAVDAAKLPTGTEFVSRDQRTSSRPDLTEARVVVGGGRPFKDKATFDKLVGGLADALAGADGATRGAVDGGMAPNDCQIGQTGKVIAPDLYFALGISGAIQHSAGIKDARVIVAVNKDPDAPIFQMATYGLVADVHTAVPQLIEAARRIKG